MIKRTFAVLALASAISTVLHAAPAETASSCFLDESQYSSFGSTYQFHKLTVGSHRSDYVTGAWQLDQGIGVLNLLSGEHGVRVGVEFVATHEEEQFRSRVAIPAPVSSHVTTRYYNAKTDRLMPVVAVLDKSTQADVFSGKAIYCNATEFVAVLTDQQLFADSEETAELYNAGPSGLMLKGSLDPETTNIAMTITSMSNEMGEETTENPTINLPLFRTSSDLGPYVPLTHYALLEEVGIVSNMLSSAVYNGPQVMSDLYVQAGDVLQDLAYKAGGALYAAPGKVKSAWEASGETYEKMNNYSEKLVEVSANNDRDIIDSVTDFKDQAMYRSKVFAKEAKTFMKDAIRAAAHRLGEVPQLADKVLDGMGDFKRALIPQMSRSVADSVQYYKDAAAPTLQATPSAVNKALEGTVVGFYELGGWLGGHAADLASPMTDWVSSVMQPVQMESNVTAHSSTLPVNLSTETVPIKEAEVPLHAPVVAVGLYELGGWLGGHAADLASPMTDWVSSVMQPVQVESNMTAHSSTLPVNLSTETVPIKEAEVPLHAPVVVGQYIELKPLQDNVSEQSNDSNPASATLDFVLGKGTLSRDKLTSRFSYSW